MIRKLMALIVVSLSVLIPLEATAQTITFMNPGLHRSGVVEGIEDDYVGIYEVPRDHVFVLTDFEWHPTDAHAAATGWYDELVFTAIVEIVGSEIEGNDRTRWLGEAFQAVLFDEWDPTGTQVIVSAASDHEWPIGFHATSGLVFEGGETVGVEVFYEGPEFEIAWRVSWSGYLVPQPQEPDALTDVDPAAGPVMSGFNVLPNPARGDLTISFRLDGAASTASVVVFDIEGRKVRTIHDGPLPGGLYSLRWDGVDDSGTRVANGAYFARVETPTDSKSKKLIVMK